MESICFIIGIGRVDTITNVTGLQAYWDKISSDPIKLNDHLKNLDIQEKQSFDIDKPKHKMNVAQTFVLKTNFKEYISSIVRMKIQERHFFGQLVLRQV